ncbi:MAG TPA: trigger factor [Gaiellaceae bacterium]|nr:trigger factor [Gaiellaceae bacterium]
MQARVEELPENKVRLTVEVPSDDMRHAVEHAASDLSASVKVPGFRKGKVPMPVLISRIGKERLYSEAVESHIGGWFRNALAGTRVRPVAQPEYDYQLPSDADGPFSFTATVDVQPKVELADWSKLEVPAAEVEVPAELVDREIEALRFAVAELVPVEGRQAQAGDTLVVDLVAANGEAQRDYVVELGLGRVVEEVEAALVGMAPGDSKSVEYELASGETASVEVTVKELKEKVLPPVDDDLARAASEFDSIADLRSDVEQRLREQIEEEAETQLRAAAVDALVDASKVQPSEALVVARTRELLAGLARSLERRGISPETYFALSNQTPQQLEERLRAEAAQSVARELVLEAVAEDAGIEVSDEELADFVREHAEAEDDDADQVVDQVFASGRHELLREDLRMRKALDRVVADVKRIPVDLARAREKLWTPDKGAAAQETKLWTPGSKEPE